MHDAARERQLMESDLRVALEKGQLRLVYQPCVDASSEAVTGFEALIRWHHPEHGPISPAEFIPLAEEIGLINEIGEWVLRTACAEAAKWPQHITVAVNLSPVQFKSHALPTIVRTVLSETDLPAKRLELEITEGVFLSNDEHVHEMIGSLKAIGAQARARRFRDRLFLAELFAAGSLRQDQDRPSLRHRRVRPERRNAALIRAMVGLASDLKMQTTAEGVETQEELQLVRTLGCSLVQGYIFGKPMPPEEALELATKGAVDRPSTPAAARTAHAHHPRGAAPLPGPGDGRAAAQYFERRGLVECREEIPVGAQIQLDFAAGGLIAAEVRWAKGTQFGCQFKEKFDLKLLQPAKARGNPVNVMVPNYLSGDEAALDK